MAKNIEVELQTFISSMEAKRVRGFLRRHAKFVGAHQDSTTYFEKNGRVRIRIEPKTALFIFKSGKMHDKNRKEIEIPFDKKYAPSAEAFLLALGFPAVIRWFRKREKWLWRGVTVTLNDTKGYGRLLELEKMSLKKEQEKNYKELLARLHMLKIQPMKREAMDARFRYYQRHWKRLI